MSASGRKKTSKAARLRIDDELASFAADPELADMFVADGLDHLGTIEQTILKLEASPADLSLVNDLFRPFHTIKGNAGVLGIRSVESFAHKLETLLDLARSGLHRLAPEDIDLVLTAVDLLRLIVNELPARAAGRPVTDVTARCESLLAAVDNAIAGGAAEQQAPALERLEEVQDNTSASPGEQSTVKVSTVKLDALVDMVGELVIAQAILAENPAL